MNENEIQPSDQELDDLLRQVNVPADLKSNLRAIPRDLIVPPSPPDSLPVNQGRIVMLLVLAASVFGIASFLVWPLLQPSDNPIVNKDASTIDKPENHDLPNTHGTGISEMELAKLNELSEQTLARLEIAQLESRLQKLQTNYQNQLEQQEYASIILALADQSVVDLGGSQATAKGNMVSIIEKFPNTRGAEIAQRFLDQQAN